MTTEAEAATDLYAKLKPGALAAARQHILTRTPPDLQDEMATLIADDLAPAPDPTVAFVSHGDPVVVHDAADAPLVGSPGAATVVDAVLTKVNLGA